MAEILAIGGVVALVVLQVMSVLRGARLETENAELREQIRKFDHDRNGKVGGSKPRRNTPVNTKDWMGV
jgi:hypothetical protein